MSTIDRILSEAARISGKQTYEKQRLIKQQQVGDVLLKLVLDDEWDEYIVQFWRGGKHIEKQDYFSGGRDPSYKADAERTMTAMAQSIQKNGPDKWGFNKR